MINTYENCSKFPEKKRLVVSGLMEVHLLDQGNSWLQSFRKKILSRQQWYCNLIPIFVVIIFLFDLFSLDYLV